MNFVKSHIVGIIIGAVVVSVGYLGFVFYNKINTVNQLVGWVCKVDPVSCGAQPKAPAPAPAPAPVK